MRYAPGARSAGSFNAQSSLWEVGEIIRDDCALKLPADLAPGAYRIEIGLYEYPGLTRLVVSDASGRMLGNHWLLPDLVQLVQ